MITDLTDIQQMLEDGSMRLAEKFAPQRGLNPGELKDPSPVLWPQICELGWPAVLASEAHGGIGGGPVEVFLLGRAHGAGLLDTPFLGASVLCGAILSELAENPTAAELLRGLAAGEPNLALAHFERSISQAIEDLTTQATVDSAGYRLNGEKVAVLSGTGVEGYIVSACAGGDAGRGREVLLLHVPADSPGLTVTPRRLVDGQLTAWLQFVDTPADNSAVLARDAQGFLERALQLGLVETLGEAAGALEAAFTIAKDYIGVRKQFGRTLSSFQVLRHRIVDMWMTVEEVKTFGLAAARALADGDPAAETMLRSAKAHVGTAGLWVAEQAVQLHGAMGVTNEAVIGQYLKRMVVIDRLFGGSRHQIAELCKTG